MSFRYRSTKYDTFTGFPRVTITDATGEYVEYNRRFPKRNSRCSLEVYAHPVAKWTSVSLHEYGESDGGNGRSKTISLTLSEEEGRAVYEYLRKVYG